MAAAPADEGSVKWQLCYDMRAKTWWMVSQGVRVGEPGSGLGRLILEGGGQSWYKSVTLGQGRGGPQPRLGLRRRRSGVRPTRRCSFGWVVSLQQGGMHPPWLKAGARAHLKPDLRLVWAQP